MAKYLLIVLIALSSSWCSRFKNKEENKPLAKVGNTYLYKDDLKGTFKEGLAPNDSAAIVASLVEKWIRKQLIVQRAELNLTYDEKNVQKELEEYRTSLLIYKYEQKFIGEKLDTVVDISEIEKYYNQNQQNFVLNNDIVKALLIQLPSKAQNVDKVRGWYISESVDDLKLLESYCYKNAKRYDYFNDEWIKFSQLRSSFPCPNQENASFLKSYRHMKQKIRAIIFT
jgi:hypothetical protein